MLSLALSLSDKKTFINKLISFAFSLFILLHEKFLQFDWLRAVVFQLNLKYLHVKITNLAGSSINNKLLMSV